MLRYPDRLQNWLNFGDKLTVVFFVNLAALWLIEQVKFGDFLTISGKPIRGMARNLTCWYILTNFGIDRIWLRIAVFSILASFWFFETGQIRACGYLFRTHGKYGMKFGMLMYPDNLQNWLDNWFSSFGCHLTQRRNRKYWFPGLFWRMPGRNGLKLDILVRIWSSMSLDYHHFCRIWLSETGQVLSFRAFSREYMGGLVSNIVCWYNGVLLPTL